MHYRLFALMLDTFGTMMIAYAALRVHHRFLHEHRIDDKVFGSMRFEQKVGVIGVSLVFLGFLLELFILFYEV